jgi:hypothetical protein
MKYVGQIGAVAIIYTKFCTDWFKHSEDDMRGFRHTENMDTAWAYVHVFKNGK